MASAGQIPNAVSLCIHNSGIEDSSRGMTQHPPVDLPQRSKYTTAATSTRMRQEDGALCNTVAGECSHDGRRSPERGL